MCFLLCLELLERAWPKPALPCQNGHFLPNQELNPNTLANKLIHFLLYFSRTQSRRRVHKLQSLTVSGQFFSKNPPPPTKTLSPSGTQAAIAESTLSVAEPARITHAIWGQSSYKSEPQSLLMRLIHHKKAGVTLSLASHSICVHLLWAGASSVPKRIFQQQGKKSPRDDAKVARAIQKCNKKQPSNRFCISRDDIQSII